MEPCPRIDNLKLDARSREGIERIREIKQLTSFLSLATALNPLASIFSKPIEASYNIGTYDWQLWSDAMKAIPQFRRGRIELEAGLQRIDHVGDTKQQRFWEAIERGCRIQDLQPEGALRDRNLRGSNSLEDGAREGASDIAAAMPAAAMAAPLSPVRFVVSKAISELQTFVDGGWESVSTRPSDAAPSGIYYAGRDVDQRASLDRPNVGPLLGEAEGFVYQLRLPERQLARYPAADMPLNASQSQGVVSVAYSNGSVSVTALDRDETQRLSRGNSRSLA